MRSNEVIQGTEGGALFTSIPFSDRSALYAESEPMTVAVRALDIDRLMHIRQLGLKHLATAPDREDMSFYRNPTGTRYEHSLTAALGAVDIATYLGFSGSDISKLRIAALLHDRKMPALGDATQMVDKPNLDEEKFWDEDLPDKAWEYMASQGATHDEIHAIINNEGPLGQILNIADRISYVTGDLQDLNRPPLDSKLGNIYKELAVDPASGEIHFINHKRLRQFLLERAWLFGMFYLDDPGQAKDFAVASMVSEFYDPQSSENDSLTPRRLRQMTDENLIQFLAQKFGIKSADFHDASKWGLRYTRTKTLEGATNTLNAINSDKRYRGLGIKKSVGFKPSTEFRVWDEFEQTHLPAHEFFNYGTSQFINGLSKDQEGFLVIYTDANNNGPTKHILRQRII